MFGVMAITMAGSHSSARTFLGASTLLLAAMVLARFARADLTIAGHVVDCFAMAVVLLLSTSDFVDATGQGHLHGPGHAIPGTVAVMLVLAGWVIIRAGLLISSRRRYRITVAGAGVTAASFALMFLMS